MNISKFVLAVLAPSLPPALAAPTALRGPDPARDEEAGALPAAPAGDRPTPVLPALAAPSLRQQDLDQDAGATAPRGGGRRMPEEVQWTVFGAFPLQVEHVCDPDNHYPDYAGFFCGKCQAENGYGYDVITYTGVDTPLECGEKCPSPGFVGYEFAHNLHERTFCGCRYEPGYVRTSETAGENDCPADAGSFLGGAPCRANPHPPSRGVGPVTSGDSDSRIACYPALDLQGDSPPEDRRPDIGRRCGWQGPLQDNEYCGRCRNRNGWYYQYIVFANVRTHNGCQWRCPESNAFVGYEYGGGYRNCFCLYEAGFVGSIDCPSSIGIGDHVVTVGPVVSGDGDERFVCRSRFVN